MKRLFLALFFVISLLVPYQAQAITTYNCDYLTGGAQRSLDYVSVDDLNNGDRAIVLYASGVSTYIGFYKYDSSGVTVENTSVHPYTVRPDDYVASGVWVEIPLSWVDLLTSLSITNLTVTNLLSVNNVAADGELSGGIPYEIAPDGSETVSGTSLWGGYITGKQDGLTGTTRILPAGTGMGENVVFFNTGNTYLSGGTLYVHATSGDTIWCNQEFEAGISKFVISGVSTWNQQILAISTEPNTWTIKTIGTPDIEWD